MFNWLFGKKKATDEIKRRPRKGRKHGVTNMLILDVLKDYKAYHYDDIARKCNLKPSTVAPALWRLDRAGKVKRIGTGIYCVVSPKKKGNSAPNGNAARIENLLKSSEAALHYKTLAEHSGLDLRPTVWALFYLKRKNRAQCIGNGFWQAVKVEAV